MPDRKIQPPITDAVNFELVLKNCERFELDNGTPVYAIDAGTQDVLMVEWVFDAGNWFEQKNIEAATANYLIKNGTSVRDALNISEHFDYYGAYLNRSCYNETATVTLHCLSKHSAALLPVVAELFTDSTLPEKELSIYQQNQQQKLSVNLKKCDFVAGRIIDDLLYGKEHPYGKYSSAEDYTALQQEALKAFYHDHYKHGHCKIFVAGKLPADLHHQLNSHFGSLPFTPVPLVKPVHLTQPATEKKYKVINDAEGVQAAIRIGRHFPNRHHPDFIKVQVLNNIFGGFFGSRLMSNIREDKGYTYGIYSFIQNHIAETAWMISTEAGRDVAEATIKEVYNEMAGLRNAPVEEEELEVVRNYMIGTILGDLDGPFQLIARWKNYILNNLSEDYFYKSIETIKTITAKELQGLANTYLNEADFYELTVI